LACCAARAEAISVSYSLISLAAGIGLLLLEFIWAPVLMGLRFPCHRIPFKRTASTSNSYFCRMCFVLLSSFSGFNFLGWVVASGSSLSRCQPCSLLSLGSFFPHQVDHRFGPVVRAAPTIWFIARVLVRQQRQHPGPISVMIGDFFFDPLSKIMFCPVGSIPQ
jgi:hypothetical protein